jgi:hypothetical protein
MGPPGLPDGCPFWGEFREDWLYVQDRRTVKSVQALHFQSQSFHRKQPADGRSNSVGPGFSTLSEDSDLRPLGIVAGMAASADDCIFTYAMQVEEHLDVRKVGEAVERSRTEPGVIEPNLGDDIAPVVFAGTLLRGVNPADGVQNDIHSRMVCDRELLANGSRKTIVMLSEVEPSLLECAAG